VLSGWPSRRSGRRSWGGSPMTSTSPDRRYFREEDSEALLAVRPRRPQTESPTSPEYWMSAMGRKALETTCRCGVAVDVCLKCWNPACPVPLCFSCLLSESGVSEAEKPELLAAVRPLRRQPEALGRFRSTNDRPG
jgi:hypothetical protein